MRREGISLLVSAFSAANITARRTGPSREWRRGVADAAALAGVGECPTGHRAGKREETWQSPRLGFRLLRFTGHPDSRQDHLLNLRFARIRGRSWESASDLLVQVSGQVPEVEKSLLHLRQR